MMVSCSKNDAGKPNAELNETDIKIHYDDIFVFYVENYFVDEWELSTDSIGTVDEDGLFKASRVGEAELSAIIKGVPKDLKAKITVEPYITDFIEPFKKPMNSEDIISGEARDFVEATSTGIRFSGEDDFGWIVYYMKDDVSYRVDVNLKRDTETFEKYELYFNERYKQTSFSKDRRTYQDGDTRITLDYTSNGAPLVFMLREGLMYESQILFNNDL